MSLLRFAKIFTVGLMVTLANGVPAQTYPDKPIRIVTIAAGSGTDIIARLVAQGITGPLGQPVIVDNRGSIVAEDVVSKAPPDGYTLLVDGGATWTTPLLQPTSYDPERDLSPISLLVTIPQVLIITPDLGVNSVAELIARAKAKPGSINYASGASGGSSHLAGELFKTLAGVNLVRVGYKGSSLAYPDLMSGQVQMMFENPGAVMSFIKAGKMKALAVTSPQPTPLVPGLPTVASTVPGFELVTVAAAVFAPAKTPQPIIARLNQEIVRYMKTPDAREKIISGGQDPVGSSPEELGKFMKSEMTKWGKVIKDAGIKN